MPRPPLPAEDSRFPFRKGSDPVSDPTFLHLKASGGFDRAGAFHFRKDGALSG